MKLTEKFSYPGVGVEDVYGLITDQAFREEACEDQHSLEYDVSIDGGTVTIVRTMPAEMPDFVKKLTGDTVKVKQTERWSDPGDGTRVADVKVSIIGQPAEMVGTAKLSTNGDNTDFVINGDVKVSIPFLGKKIEPEVHKAIVASLHSEVELGMTKL
ncbi:hypothetical protein HMPREF0063_11997 [Aeromicrobium marinum DSM 15272]|uniref:DUF2505 domain-containing protein n=1 Tax=Aeromicrobium marinum DSM 15272 TaxID=585531 RepID=E2SE61_9ACTN|nr:DUF2505 domain-containing protein [Aeromicrobium marinum]EFQ82788.1 hypothetical protein HMPREF0063_11997 [Aeromicrobium marinum DSM 15272]